MANSYFQFKQFTIHQDKCAMKVCTDACLFGAFVAHCPLPTANCLDIGTGTGLLSLMMAQKSSSIIDAVEIDESAFHQAKENFEASPWKERLHIFNIDIANFTSEKKYDLVICNPPFFEDDLRSKVELKNKAKHEGSLHLQELLKIMKANLNENGSFAVLLPFHRVNAFEKMAEKENFYPANKILIRQSTAHEFFRGILIFSKEKKEILSTAMAIKNDEGDYTDEFRELLAPYYLNL